MFAVSRVELLVDLRVVSRSSNCDNLLRLSLKVAILFPIDRRLVVEEFVVGRLLLTDLQFGVVAP